MTARPASIGAMVDAHRLVVCVGTGGVGKTTMAAAIALGAAMRGRRAMVLTIDPARALARSLGLAALGTDAEEVPAAALAAAGLALTGRLSAAMLDQKRAWDGFIRRHAPDAKTARAILDNRFYDELSTSFAGSTEYMAIEETCRLAESGRYDLIVLDTPPAAHALDFLRAPERLDPLLDRRVAALLSHPAAAVGAVARAVVRRLERAVGGGTLADVSALLAAFESLLDDATARTRRARELLRGGRAGFVLVAGPRQLMLEETGAFLDRLHEVDAELGGVVLNRAHLPPAAAPDAIAAQLDALGEGEPARWVREAWADAVAEAAAEHEPVARFFDALRPEVARAVIPDAARDVHSLAELAGVATRLWA